MIRVTWATGEIDGRPVISSWTDSAGRRYVDVRNSDGSRECLAYLPGPRAYVTLAELRAMTV
jgi:hypothetical protein